MPEKTAENFRAAIKLGGGTHIYNRLGIALRKQGFYKEAIIEYNLAISLDPED
ncbi:MAG: tetratricopeptide repeat protein [Nitrospinae bacterium]|nr:tetratricopeptide repeat protein [Nitrospinota bacterium]